MPYRPSRRISCNLCSWRLWLALPWKIFALLLLWPHFFESVSDPAIQRNKDTPLTMDCDLLRTRLLFHLHLTWLRWTSFSSWSSSYVMHVHVISSILVLTLYYLVFVGVSSHCSHHVIHCWALLSRPSPIFPPPVCLHLSYKPRQWRSHLAQFHPNHSVLYGDWSSYHCRFTRNQAGKHRRSAHDT